MLPSLSTHSHEAGVNDLSRDQKTIDHFLATLSFGGGAINHVNIHLFIETMPFGGVGFSGIGHYYGKAGFDALTHAKSVFNLSSRRGHRAFVPAVHGGEGQSAQPVV